jgi:amino acid permease
MTGTSSYREAWEDTVGDAGSGLVALFTTLMAGLGNLAYSMILADTTRSLLQTAGLENISRTQCLVGVTVLALWPLCNVKQLAVLAPFSLLGMAGMIFTVVAMAWRFWDGSYDLETGRFIRDIPDNMKPSFGRVGASGALSIDAVLLVCMTFQAFFAHYNSPRYYVELKNNTVERFGIVVGTSFGISALMYVAMAAFGFLLFGANSSGFILNNYSTKDVLATICRIAIAVALVFTYPLPFIGTRDGILALLEVPIEKQTSQNLNVLTVVILAVITLLAMVFTDLGKVNAVGGALFGTAVVFVFPAIMLRRAVDDLGYAASRRQVREAQFAVALMWAGIVVGATGVVIALVGL